MNRIKLKPILIPSLGLLAATAFANDSIPSLTFRDPSVAQVTTVPDGAMPDRWTFDDCISWATVNSTDIRRSILNILQSEESVGAAKDAWLPNVGFSMNHSFTNYPNPEENRTANVYGSSYGVNASWTVWEGNVRKYRLESAKLTLQQQRLAGDDVVKTLKLGILQAYLNILYADEAVAIARQTLEVSASQTDRAKKLMESGRTSKVDYAQIESQMAQDKYNLTQAESNYATARMNLKTILQLSLDYDLKIADVPFSDSEVNTALPTMEQVYALASDWLPQIKSNELNKDIYEYDIKIAKAGRLPEIGLSGGVGTGYTSGGPSWGSQMGHGINENVGVNFSIPIYDANSTRRKVAQAKLSALQYDLNKKDLLDDLSQTIESLYIDARNARARYESGKVQLEATQLTSDLVNRQFELGLVNPLELLTAHNNLLNARLEQLQNKYMAILANKTINYYATQEVALP